MDDPQQPPRTPTPPRVTRLKPGMNLTDNLFQAFVILAFAALGFWVGRGIAIELASAMVQSTTRIGLLGGLIGGVAGIIAGAFVSGFILMIFGWLRKSKAK